MDSRWRFLHHDKAELRGRVRQRGPGGGKPGPSGVPAGQEKPARVEGNRDGDRTKSREAQRTARREKPLLSLSCPYRKPTQVDGERIPRPAEEALPRNSAKWPRNFGRRGACLWQAAENRLKQLFSKNTGLCETER